MTDIQCFAFLMRFFKARNIDPANYFRNLTDDNLSWFKEVNKRNNLSDNFINIIDNSFYWEDTPEGHTFWSDIHNAFKIALRTKKEKILTSNES